MHGDGHSEVLAARGSGNSIAAFCKKSVVLIVATVAAAVSCFSLRPTKGIWIISTGALSSVCSVCLPWWRHSDIFVGKSVNVQAVLRDTVRQGGKIPACVPRTQLRVPWRDAAVLLFSADCPTGRGSRSLCSARAIRTAVFGADGIFSPQSDFNRRVFPQNLDKRATQH